MSLNSGGLSKPFHQERAPPSTWCNWRRESHGVWRIFLDSWTCQECDFEGQLQGLQRGRLRHFHSCLGRWHFHCLGAITVEMSSPLTFMVLFGNWVDESMAGRREEATVLSLSGMPAKSCPGSTLPVFELCAQGARKETPCSFPQLRSTH